MNEQHILSVYRVKFDSDSPERGIVSNIYFDGVYICDAIEPCRKSKYGCVEQGVYSLIYKYSPSFNRKMYYLDMDKFGSPRSGIMFHKGNSAEDTKGCICPGYDTIKGSFFITGSSIALSIVEENIARCGVSNVVVEIIDQYDL